MLSFSSSLSGVHPQFALGMDPYLVLQHSPDIQSARGWMPAPIMMIAIRDAIQNPIQGILRLNRFANNSELKMLSITVSSLLSFANLSRFNII